jgi:hypothetical protein
VREDKRLLEQCGVGVWEEEQSGVPHVPHGDNVYSTAKELFVAGKVLFALRRIVFRTEDDNAPLPVVIGGRSEKASLDHIGGDGKMREHRGSNLSRK